MRPLRVTRAGIAGTLLALAVAATCARLGVWQLHRLEQRRERNRAIAARLAAPPVPLRSLVADTTGLLYRRVLVEGVYDDGHTIVLHSRSLHGTPGAHIVTPLRFPDGGAAVLVDRGWMPAPDGATVDRAALREPGTVRLEGIALPLLPARHPAAPFRGAVRELDPATLRRTLPYRLLDLTVQALPSPDAPARPVRLPPPTLDDGPHLGYAVQWFAFATIALGGWAALAARRARRGGATTGAAGRAPRPTRPRSAREGGGSPA